MKFGSPPPTLTLLTNYHSITIQSVCELCGTTTSDCQQYALASISADGIESQVFCCLTCISKIIHFMRGLA